MIRCQLGWHKWSRWIDIKVQTRVYYQDIYIGTNESLEQRRVCQACGKTQQVRRTR